jgi:deoxyribose-phosphate aldolase
MLTCNYHDVAKMIDHALLSPTLDREALAAGCRLAAAYDVASVCILPYAVRQGVEILADTTVVPSTVIGFPHGGQTTAVKVAEAGQAIADGAIELDMVCNISAVLSDDWIYVADEIKAIVDLAHAEQRRVKVIFENCYLQDRHKRKLCEICCAAGADWVKTSTGFGSGGATMEDLRLMIDHVTAPTEVKAAGGVRDLGTLLQVRELGVTRVGASATATILDAARVELKLPAIKIAGGPAAVGY